MQSITRPLLAVGLTVTAADSSYTAPPGTFTQFRACTVTNKDASAHTVTVSATVADADGSPVTIVLVPGQGIAPGQAWIAGPVLAQALSAGDKVQFAADAPSVLDLMLTGTEST
jgi:hypothetical protein